MRLVAARIGQRLNFRTLSGELGISETILKTYLTVLEKTALVYLLPEHSEDGRNRKHQSHKVYFTDTGLCAFLSGWTTKEALIDGAMSDLMFENFVIIEILKSYRNRGVEPLLSYFRSRGSKEISLLIEDKGKLHPIEIKITASPRLSMVENFEYSQETNEEKVLYSVSLSKIFPSIKKYPHFQLAISDASLVALLCRNHASHSSPWVLHISFMSRNKVNVHMKN